MLVAIPMLGFLFGGIYSFPAIKLTRGKEPWLGILLAAGLAVTIFGIGLPGHLSVPLLALLWVCSILLLLLARWFFGPLNDSLEHFGIVHVITLILVLGAGAWLRRGHHAVGS